jgi:hypothetical protein
MATLQQCKPAVSTAAQGSGKVRVPKLPLDALEGTHGLPSGQQAQPQQAHRQQQQQQQQQQQRQEVQAGRRAEAAAAPPPAAAATVPALPVY